MSLETNLGDIKLKNPLILASGILGASYSSLQRMYDAGMGAVVTKSIGKNPRSGSPNPTIFALVEIKSIVSSVGLANPGYKTFKEDLVKLTEKQTPTIVSIFGETKEDIGEIIEGLNDLPLLAFELNLGYSKENPKTVQEKVGIIKQITNKPLWVKLTPDECNVIKIAEAAVNCGCNALVAINKVKAMVIDIKTKQPVLGAKKGGISGSVLKPIGVRCVYDLYEHFGDKIPIIGVGGISKGEDVIEYLLAGASAVQIGSAVGVAYPENMVRFIQMGIRKYLREQNIENLDEIIGGAFK